MKPKKPKESFVGRIQRRGRETAALGHTLVHEPRAFPRQASGLLKRSFRTMWQARGGGFYACGFVVTFIVLEIMTLVGEIAGSDGVVAFFTEQFLEFVLRFSMQSLGNTIQAFLWPLLIIDRLGPMSIALLLAAYLLFARFLKPKLTEWLFDDDAVAATAASEPPAAPATESEPNEDSQP